MILTLKNKSFLLCVVVLGSFLPFLLHAQVERSQTLSVSPTLFQMTANPSQSWESEIRVVNVNDFEITVYPQVVNFAPSGESGTGTLIPIFTEETKGTTLAEWVTLTQSEVVIAPGQTATIPFSVRVTADAAPGGHYAAILVGTKPPQENTAASQVQTAQFVTSLLFVRVSGDVVESGNIREFSTEKTINNDPDIQFNIRFENTGNVHLQPQGDITITNMWGTERGVIPINYQTHFGNVLPASIRKFSFSWTGAKSSYDIGRFKAIATLGYGEDTKNFSTSTTYFWVIPLQQILIIFTCLALMFWFFSFVVKLYIKRMLVLAGLEPGSNRQNNVRKDYKEYSSHAEVPTKTVIIQRYQTVTAPVRYSVREFLENIKAAHAVRDILKVCFQFIFRNKISILFIGMVIGVFALTFWFFSESNTKSRPYDVGIINPDSTVVISSDEILYKNLPEYELPPGVQKVSVQPFTIELVNASGEPGLAAKVRRKLEAYGYTVDSIKNELGRTDAKSVIIFHPDNKVAALDLSKMLQQALLSTDQDISKDSIRIYIGTDNRL